MEYVEKFIHLQKDAVNNPERITFNANIENRDLMLPPLLLITFIENCFKHGSVSEETDFIRISIKTTGTTLTLNTRNSVVENTFTPDRKSSLGLENAQRRLELSLPDNYSLDYGIHNNEFHLSLTLEL